MHVSKDQQRSFCNHQNYGRHRNWNRHIDTQPCPTWTFSVNWRGYHHGVSWKWRALPYSWRLINAKPSSRIHSKTTQQNETENFFIVNDACPAFTWSKKRRSNKVACARVFCRPKSRINHQGCALFYTDVMVIAYFCGVLLAGPKAHMRFRFRCVLFVQTGCQWVTS